jgi:hypothetical protein
MPPLAWSSFESIVVLSADPTPVPLRFKSEWDRSGTGVQLRYEILNGDYGLAVSRACARPLLADADVGSSASASANMSAAPRFPDCR